MSATSCRSRWSGSPSAASRAKRTRVGWDIICRNGDPTNVHDLVRAGAQKVLFGAYFGFLMAADDEGESKMAATMRGVIERLVALLDDGRAFIAGASPCRDDIVAAHALWDAGARRACAAPPDLDGACCCRCAGSSRGERGAAGAAATASSKRRSCTCTCPRGQRLRTAPVRASPWRLLWCPLRAGCFVYQCDPDALLAGRR